MKTRIEELKAGIKALEREIESCGSTINLDSPMAQWVMDRVELIEAKKFQIEILSRI